MPGPLAAVFEEQGIVGPQRRGPGQREQRRAQPRLLVDLGRDQQDLDRQLAAQRRGELRDGRGSGDWYESTTGLAAVRAFYHLPKRWDALVEYRWLGVDETDTDRRGFLLGVDRKIGDNLKLGVGYNFTDFSDDLTELDYERRFAVAAFSNGEGIAIARFEPAGDGIAELAVVVKPEWRRLGLATQLFALLEAAAIERGMNRLEAFYLAENHAIERVLEKRGFGGIETAL